MRVIVSGLRQEDPWSHCGCVETGRDYIEAKVVQWPLGVLSMDADRSQKSNCIKCEGMKYKNQQQEKQTNKKETLSCKEEYARTRGLFLSL